MMITTWTMLKHKRRVSKPHATRGTPPHATTGKSATVMFTIFVISLVLLMLLLELPLVAGNHCIQYYNKDTAGSPSIGE